jgi:hypothetical protein
MGRPAGRSASEEIESQVENGFRTAKSDIERRSLDTEEKKVWIDTLGVFIHNEVKVRPFCPHYTSSLE